MATEAEKSAVDQGHTAESAIALPPAPVATVAIAAAPLLSLAPPAVVATSAVPLPLSPAPPPNLPHAGFVSGAPVPVAQPSHVAQPPAQVVAGGPALGTAVGAGPDSAHLVAPSAAPLKPVAQRLTESQIHLAAGGNAAAHWGRGSPRRRPSSSYRSAHRGGRGGWWGGHGHRHGGPSEMQQLREDFPGMLVGAMRNALNGAPNLAGGGGARGAFVPPRRFAEAPCVQPPPPLPIPSAALRTGMAQVPTATLAQLWRLVECQQALTLILVNAHFAILQSPGSTLGREARGDCLAAAAQHAFLLLPLLGAHAMGGVAVSELDGAVQDSEPGTWSAWGLSPREWGEVQSALRAETPPASQESGQQPSAAQRSREPDGGCGTKPSPHARADTRAASAHAEERPGLGLRRRGDRWSPQYGRESAPHSPGPASPPPRTCPQHDRGLDQAGCHSRLALRPSASPAVPRKQPNVDAGGTARGDPNPSDDQATPSPASPEIAEENVARGIALAVSAGLPDHEGMGGEGSEDVQENAYPPPRADSARDAQEKGGEERVAVEGAAEASTRAPAAADRPGGSTQHEQAPTNTPARRGARQDDGEAFEPARSGARARSRRGAQGDADEARQAQAAVASSPRNPPAPDPVSRMGPSPPILPQPTPVRRRSENETAAAPQTGREGAAVGRATRGIRVGRGSRRGRRGNERGRRGGGARDSNRRRSGASGYARNVERLMRNGAEGDVEPLSEEAEEEAENEESEEGDPAFNPESEGMLEAEAEEDEEELELLREAELPNQQARVEKLRREAKSVNRGPVLSRSVKIKREAGEAWDLSPRGWGEAQSELRAAETSPPGPESGQPYSEEQGNLGLGGVRGTAPSTLQLADTPARSERAAERLQPQQVRWGAQWSQTREREPLLPTLPPPELHPPPYSPRGQQWNPSHDYPRRAHNHSAAHDALQTQPTEDGAGTAHGGENPNGPHEPRGPDAEATAAASAAEGTAPAGSASPATSQESGSGGRDAEFPADIRPIVAESHAARRRDAQGTRVDIHDATGTGPAPDAPARHSTRRLGEHGIAQETRDDPPRAAEETTRAQDGARAPTQQDEPALGNTEAQARAQSRGVAHLADDA
ncbi:unnamed protein product [Closterium sp. NIES-64]|nr:unnamed protein product [Closterium sp. NIES-64]